MFTLFVLDTINTAFDITIIYIPLINRFGEHSPRTRTRCILNEVCHQGMLRHSQTPPGVSPLRLFPVNVCNLVSVVLQLSWQVRADVAGLLRFTKSRVPLPIDPVLTVGRLCFHRSFHL